MRVLRFIVQVGGHGALKHEIGAFELLGLLLESLEYGLLVFTFGFLGLNVKLWIGQLLIEEADLLFDLLHDAFQRFGFLFNSIQVLGHLYLIMVWLGLVRIVVPVFSLEEVVVFNERADILFEVTVIRMATPGNEAAVFDQHSKRQTWHLKILFHFFKVVLVPNPEG